jgi:hypothetical protein
MNKKFYLLHLLIPPAPFSCKQKKGEIKDLPLFAKQRGVGVSSCDYMIDI